MTQLNHKTKAHKTELHAAHRTISLVVIALAVVVFIFGFAIGGTLFYQKGRHSRLADSATLKTYKTGSTVSTSHMDLRVSDVSYDTKGGHQLKPAKGNQFLILRLYVKNKTDQIMPLFPLNQVKVKDDNGHVFNATVAEIADMLQSGHLQPGDQIQGQLAFEIPQSLHHPTFFFDSGWTDSFISVKL